MSDPDATDTEAAHEPWTWEQRIYAVLTVALVVGILALTGHVR